MSNEDLDLLTVPEVARLLKVTTRTVYVWLNAGRIPSVKFGTAHNSPRRIERSAVEAFIGQYRQEALVS